MEELFDSLLGDEMTQTGAEDILSDTSVDDPVNTDEDILEGENLVSGVQFVDDTFATSSFNSDDSSLFNEAPITNMLGGSEYMLFETSITNSGVDALGASAGIADSFLSFGSDNNFLNPVEMQELDVSNDNVESLRDMAAGICPMNIKEYFPATWFNDVRQLYGEGLSNEMISQSVEETCDFFHIDEPAIVSEGWTTGVYPNNDFTLQDDVLVFNREQLLDMGISGKDGLDLVMTHEGTHRVLQGMEHLEFDAHQEELCCDYMAGVRAGLNGIDVSQMENSLMYTPESETHPAGVERVESIEAGVRFAQQYYAEYNMAPTFNECLDNFCEVNEIEQQKQITLRVENTEDEISFKGVLPPDNNGDGYIPDGRVTLERTESGNSDTFKVYNKDGGQYVHEGGAWIRIDGSGTVNIKGVKYDRI